MNYPLISEYVEAIKSAEDNFRELSFMRPVLGDDGLPVMTSGNFAVVFKMKDEQSGKIYAVKCFTKEQDGRSEAYQKIVKELEKISSPYLVAIRYLEKELFVDTDQTTETEFPILLMDWAEGMTLDKYLRENLDDRYALEMLAYRFSQLAQWLIPQPFAHGDLKPDNILVREDDSLVLVDYDGMYVPAMKGQKARELGSPDFRHPLRTKNDFDEHIDEFSLVSIFLSLKTISLEPSFLEIYGSSDRLLFSDKDYRDVRNSEIISNLCWSYDDELNRIVNFFSTYCEIKLLKLDTSIFKVLKPSPLVNSQTSLTFEQWSSKIKRDNGYAYYSHDLKKLLRFFDTIGGCYMGDDWEDFISDYNINNGTIIICNKAFKGCHKLRYLKIPSSVRFIGENAFTDCHFRYIELPNTIEYISKNAFDNCMYLRTIVIPTGTFRKFSQLLPNNVSQLKELNTKYVKKQFEDFLVQEKNKGLTYWITLVTLLSSISRVMGLFGELKFDYLKNGNDEGVNISVKDNSFFCEGYHIKNINSIDEIVDAFYHLLLDIIGVDIFNRTSYLYSNYDISI